MGQTDVLWARQCNFYPQSHLCCEEKPLTAPSGVVYHCGGGTVIGKQTEKSFKCKTLCLMETQRVCNGTITGLQLHPNVPLTPL